MQRAKVNKIVLSGAMILTGLVAGHVPAMAGLKVKQATKAPTLEIGKILQDDHEFDLPDASEVRLERTPAGTPFRMHGPYKGTLETYLKKCSGWLAFTHSFCKDDSGPTPGISRSTKKQ